MAAMDNHFLPPSDNDNDNGADPAVLMGKYKSGENKKWKWGHSCRYRDDNNIEALHGLYEEPKDNDNNFRDDDGNDVNWDDMEEKEREEDDDNSDDLVDITAV